LLISRVPARAGAARCGWWNGVDQDHLAAVGLDEFVAVTIIARKKGYRDER
jgi:hypothetical protein